MTTMALPLPKTVNGVPLHPLVVHAVVVLLPLAVLGTIGIVIWPAMRRHLGLLVVLVAFVGLVSVPLATSSGQQFRNQLGAAQLVRAHQHYAQKLLPLTAGLVVLLALVMAIDLARRLGADREGAAAPSGPVPTRLDRTVGRLLPARLSSASPSLQRAQPVLGVLTVVVALVLAWYVYKTGDSGAKAVWQGRIPASNG